MNKEFEILCIFYTIVFVLLLILRMSYINSICNNWNKKLLEYVKVCDIEKGKEKEYYMKAFLNPIKIYLRLDYWGVKDIISDKLLLDDIDRLEYKKGLIKIKHKNIVQIIAKFC